MSSREARTLGGNRTIAEPLELKFGKLPGDYAKPLVRKTVVGIGAELRIDPELRELYVVNTVFGGPADRAGIAQDAIVSIEGVGDLVNVPIAERRAARGRRGDGRQPGGAPLKRRGRARRRPNLRSRAKPPRWYPSSRAMDVEGGGGLFTGEGARPSPARGVRPGGAQRHARRGEEERRRARGRRYIPIREDEIPPGATFKLEVEPSSGSPRVGTFYR